MTPVRLAVLLSGRGSNFQSIHEAIRERRLPAEIVCVISNRPHAPGLEKALEYGYPAHAIDHNAFRDRAAHEEEVARVLKAAWPDLIVLAGYMRLLTAPFVERFRHRILNIHPSLLPAFPGIDAQRQAFDYGVKVAGCTVHFVDENLDAGPIVAQRTIPVLESDTAASLAERILGEEHRTYVDALIALSTRAWRIEGRRVVLS